MDCLCEKRKKKDTSCSINNGLICGSLYTKHLIFGVQLGVMCEIESGFERSDGEDDGSWR